MATWTPELYSFSPEHSVALAECLLVLLRPDGFLKSISDSFQTWRNSPSVDFYRLEMACPGTAGSVTSQLFLFPQGCLTLLSREVNAAISDLPQAWPSQWLSVPRFRTGLLFSLLLLTSFSLTMSHLSKNNQERKSEIVCRFEKRQTSWGSRIAEALCY